MKNIAVVFLILFAILLVGFYIYSFGYSISDEQEVWGAFGDYIGGLLNPLIAFLVFYYVIKNYESQQEYFKKQEFENHFFKLYDELKYEVDTLQKSDILEQYNKQIETGNIIDIKQYKEFIYKRSDYPNSYFNLLKFILVYTSENKEIKDYSFLIKNKLSNLDLLYLALHDISQENNELNKVLKELNIFEFINLGKKEIPNQDYLFEKYDLLKDKLVNKNNK